LKDDKYDSNLDDYLCLLKTNGKSARFFAGQMYESGVQVKSSVANTINQKTIFACSFIFYNSIPPRTTQADSLTKKLNG
jgi:hypothetical protein